MGAAKPLACISKAALPKSVRRHLCGVSRESGSVGDAAGCLALGSRLKAEGSMPTSIQTYTHLQGAAKPLKA